MQQCATMKAQDQINAILDGVNAQNASKDLTDRVLLTDTGLFEGLFFVGQLTDELTERVARLEELQGSTARTVDVAANVSDTRPGMDELLARVARLEALQGSTAQSSDVGAKLNGIHREIGDIHREVGDTKSQIDDTRSDVQRLTQGLARADAREWAAEATAMRAPLKDLQSRFWTLGEADDPVGLEQWAHEMLPVADEFKKWVDAHPCPDASRAAAASQMEKDASSWSDVAGSILDKSLTSEDRIAHVSEILTDMLTRQVGRLGTQLDQRVEP